MTWLRSPAHFRWLEQEADDLLAFAAGSAVEEGFGYLDSGGEVIPERGVQLWITCRMVHSYSLGSLLGRPGAGALADHGIDALNEHFRDAEYGGWFSAVGQAPSDVKEAYAHAFVILAAASATAAARPGAAELLEEALRISDEHFWREGDGLVVESWDRTFTELEDYRGVNANMHTVEAYLTVADVTGNDTYLDRAVRITERVLGFAREHDWRIPEHFDAHWGPILDYNIDHPAHPFRPAGATVGHWFEWARLALHANAALELRGQTSSPHLTAGAIALFDRATAEGWDSDGAEGFVYTVDFDGQPLVRERMHWVVTEAIGAASALFTATGDPAYEQWYRTWWDYAAAYLLDEASWVHELSPANEPSETVWSGKPDIYHALQATLIPRLPLSPVFAPALATGMLDSTIAGAAQTNR